MRDFVIQNNTEISPPILETSWKPVNRKSHPEVRPPLRSGGGSVPDSDQVRAVKFVRSAQKRARHLLVSCSFLEAPPGIGPGIEVLQTFALPLGYGAVQLGTGSFSLFRIIFKSRVDRHCF